MTDLIDLVTGGTPRRVTRWSESILHETTQPVTVFDDELATLIRDMFATMDAAEGVGLAAPQVDDNRALFIFRCPDEDDQVQVGVVINPMIDAPQGQARHLVSEDEGCLSLPGAFAPLARPDSALCRGVDFNGAPIAIIGTGMLARCLQHETDHLSGMVFGDRLSARSRKRLYADHEAVAYRYPDQWPTIAKGEFDPARQTETEA